MIYVEGNEICKNSNLVETYDIIWKLLKHSYLSARTVSFKSMAEVSVRNFINFKCGKSEDAMNFLYVFQKEYATVNPTLVKFVGTDELTTCVGVVIHNRTSGMISVGHLDCIEVVNVGLKQMLAKLTLGEKEEDLEIHLVGGFDDLPCQVVEDGDLSVNDNKDDSQFEQEQDKNHVIDGYSWPLLLKIVQELQKMKQVFHMETFCVLNHNTVKGPNQFGLPIVKGFLVNTHDGSLLPACFDKSTRCPDEIVRRVFLSFSSGDSNWRGKLLDTYDTERDLFIIAPCQWSRGWSHYAAELLNLSDSELLFKSSTSPEAENSDFVDTQRQVYSYMVAYPDWRMTFPNGKARVFHRSSMGQWTKYVE